MRWWKIFLFLISLALSASAFAQIPVWRPTPTTDRLEFGSLRLDPAFAASPPAGEWKASLVLSQFNLWGHTWHTQA